jgi:hypothetical protein
MVNPRGYEAEFSKSGLGMDYWSDISIAVPRTRGKDLQT